MAMDWKIAIRTMLLIVVTWLGVLLVIWLVATIPYGCATLQDVGEVRTAVVDLEQRIGEINIGGDGDSVTSWILAAGAGGAALFYPLAWRPVRRWHERNGKAKA